MKSNILFIDAYENYLKYISLKLKPQSIKSINSRFQNYIIPYFKNFYIDDITPQFYLEWQQKINDLGFKYSYKKSLHYAMCSFYNYLNIFYEYKKNIPKKVGNFINNTTSREIKFLNIKDYERFIDSFKTRDIIYKYFFEFLFFTGVRLGEANALQFCDVIDNIVSINKTISKEKINGQRIITSPKSIQSNRKIKIDNVIINEILELKNMYKKMYRNYNDNFYIFGGIEPLSPTTITRKKNYYCNIANISNIRVHDFRHSHATLLLANNVPLEEISHRLGHSDINITLNTYTHFFPEYEKRVIETLNSIHTITKP